MVCRLVVPLAQAGSVVALEQSLPRLRALTAAQLKTEADRCASSLRAADIAPFKRALVDARLDSVTLVHDHDLAEGKVASGLRLLFVRLAGGWRLGFSGA